MKVVQTVFEEDARWQLLWFVVHGSEAIEEALSRPVITVAKAVHQASGELSAPAGSQSAL